MYLKIIQFQPKVINFANDFMYNYDLKIIREIIKQQIFHQIINEIL